MSLFDPSVVDHTVARELEHATAWLDVHPQCLDAVRAGPAAVAVRRGSSWIVLRGGAAVHGVAAFAPDGLLARENCFTFVVLGCR